MSPIALTNKKSSTIQPKIPKKLYFTLIATPLNKKFRQEQLSKLAINHSGKMTGLTFLQRTLFFSLTLALLCTCGHITLDTDICKVKIGYISLEKQLEDKTEQMRQVLARRRRKSVRYIAIQIPGQSLVSTTTVPISKGRRFRIRTYHGLLSWFNYLTNRKVHKHNDAFRFQNLTVMTKPRRCKTLSRSRIFAIGY